MSPAEHIARFAPIAVVLECNRDLLNILCGVNFSPDKPGYYLGEVFDSADTQKGKFTLQVVDGVAEPGVLIDLASDLSSSPTFRVATGGNVYVHVASGTAGYWTRLISQNGVLFNNKALAAGQLFVLTLYRPGEHIVEDTVNKASCKVSVRYPSREVWQQVKTADPIKISIQPGAMNPAAVTVGPGQGLVFTVLDKSKIASTLMQTRDLVEGREMLTRISS